jgi:hypothetical protein
MHCVSLFHMLVGNDEMLVKVSASNN